ncbi:MAG: hypothetical protein JWR26_4231 [Pedosphaera sp.]|nr:hypothetical protein [Pedosphaera sp.]
MMCLRMQYIRRIFMRLQGCPTLWHLMERERKPGRSHAD